MPEFNPMMGLHGEQHIEFYKPIRPDVKIHSTFKIADIADKKSGAFVVFEIDTYEIDEEGKKTQICKQYNCTFVRGVGGFGYKGKVSFPLP